MKKLHLVLLVIAAVTALLSAYSLAAINQVYKINFEWYSWYHNTYVGEYRETSRDRWLLDSYPEQMEFSIIGDRTDAELLKKNKAVYEGIINGTDFGKYILLYSSLGEFNSPEYKVKIISIAQRGNVVEIKVSLNSPVKKNDKLKTEYTYSPKDIIRIDKKSFPIKGRLWFVFKNQYGNQLYEKYYEIK